MILTERWRRFLKKKLKMKTNELIKNKPVRFIEKILNSPLWRKQKEIVQSVYTHNVIAVKSCHGSGKTHAMSRIVLAFLFSHPNSVVITTAPTFRQVEQIMWRYIRKTWKNSKVNLGGIILKTKYEIDEDWYALGVSSDIPENFVGFHAKNILVVFDEGSGIADPIYEATQGLLTSDGSVHVVIGNPTKRTGEFYKMFLSRDVYKITISCFDTPNFTHNKIFSLDDLTEDRAKNAEIIMPALITPMWVWRLIQKYGSDSDVVRVRALAKFPKKDPDTLISVDLIEACIGGDIDHIGSKRVIGVDVARFGDDFTQIVERIGNVAKIMVKFIGNDTMKTAGYVARWLRDNPDGVAHIDVIGVGGGVVDRLKEQDDITDRVFGINSASSAHDSEHYINQRAEGWDGTMKWLRDGAVLERGEYEDDWYELAQPRYKFSSSGKLQIESKEEMKKRGVASPNCADALVLTIMRPHIAEIKMPNIRMI